MRQVAVVTTGFFDGVHLGHRHVLERLVSSARERGEEALVVTFWPHPRTVLQQDARDFRLLTSLEEKKELLLGCGVDRVEVIPFTRQFAAMKASEYLQLLHDRYGASLVVMGYDNRLGSDGKTVSELAGASAAEGCHCKTASAFASAPFVDFVAVPPLTWPRVATGFATTPSSASSPAISSTISRKALIDGEIEEVERMLGYKYSLYGVVVAGNRLGRTIGFPTANMQLYEPLKLVPGNGVYAAEVEVDGRLFRGMTNIGIRPTVGGTTRTIETHILDGFNEDIYGLPIRLRFLSKIRDERRFDSLDALKAQLQADSLFVSNRIA